MDTRRPCPCCGHLVFDIEEGWPGSHVICPICFWEDDAVQFRWPFMPSGANRVSLVQAQRNFQDFEACDQQGRRSVRPPAADEPLCLDWRPIDPAMDTFEDWRSEDRRPWPDDRSVLCWWLPSFWGLSEEPEPAAGEYVVIDVGPVRTERDLHALLKAQLKFPAFYGMNWDAFWDAITGLVEMPTELRFVRWAELELRAPLAAATLRRLLARYEAAAEAFNIVYDGVLEVSEDAYGPVAEIFRLVRAQVPGLSVELATDETEVACFALRIEGSLESVEVQCQRAGRSPFIVSDEYSWIQVDDPVAGAEAVLGLLRA